MISVMRRLLSASVIRFAITGVLNTLVGLGVIFALKWFFGVADPVANGIGYGVGLIFSYLVNSRWTFGYRQSILAVLPRYALVMALAYLANLCCLQLALHIWQLNGYLAQALTVVPYAVVGYLGMRWWVFRQPKRSS